MWTGSKYHNKKEEIDGIIFDSKKEAQTYKDLKREEEEGKIKSFKLQVPFELIPAQRETTSVQNKKGAWVYKERVVEKAVVYKADFVVYHLDGTVTVIDCKGMRTPAYIIKRKLMRYVLALAIKEV